MKFLKSINNPMITQITFINSFIFFVFKFFCPFFSLCKNQSPFISSIRTLGFITYFLTSLLSLITLWDLSFSWGFLVKNFPFSTNSCSVACYSISIHLWVFFFFSFLLEDEFQYWWSEKMLFVYLGRICIQLHLGEMFFINLSSPSDLMFHLRLLFPCWLSVWMIYSLM